MSSRRTGVAGGALSASSDRGGGTGGGGGGGVSSKMARSMSFSASFTHYGVRDVDGDEEEGELESRKEEDDEEDERLTVIDYTRPPSHAHRTPRKQRPPVPAFPRLSPTSSPSPPSKPHSLRFLSRIAYPVQPVTRPLPSPLHTNRHSRPRLDSYDVGRTTRARSAARAAAAPVQAAAAEAAADATYCTRPSSAVTADDTAVARTRRVRARREGEEFSRQFVEEGDNEAVGSGRIDDAITAEEEEELEEAYRAVINYSQ